jgi:Na+-transporting methylmalonyl-CoA/oxaloacetate decarboxylase gamma subunit
MADSYFKQSKTLILLSVLGIFLVLATPIGLLGQGEETPPSAPQMTDETVDNTNDDDSKNAPDADPDADPEWHTRNGLAKGGALAITGLVIVFVGLIAISVFITVLPHALEVVNHVLPESDHHHAHAAPAKKPAPVASSDDEKAIVAGIAFAIHSRNR